ncbi:hypothetical protein F4780DRAFT_783730 [Xylariomycetidae sp. FL0641]|nr:hypothetical protein F4780DRAFT_783730 [Xylariomycetidae sp. FL0641]
MATPRLTSSPTCLSCLRRLATAPQPHLATTTTTRSFSVTPARSAAKLTKAELEDLQGIPVRLLRDIPAFGKKHAIIRVKAGRMRNLWFPRAAAEYMTKDRFRQLGLTEANIGVRDRTFGSKMMLDLQKGKLEKDLPKDHKNARKETLSLSPTETAQLLTDLLPAELVFTRKPIAPAAAPAAATPPPPPAKPRSPALAANAATSMPDPEPAPAPAAPATPAHERGIFGSVSAHDVLAQIKDLLSVDQHGARVALEVDAIVIGGLAPDEDRIKRLGTFEVAILPGRDLPPVRRVVRVEPDE